MKKLLLGLAISFALSLNVAQAQVWSQNFNTGIPTNWIHINADGKTPNTNLGANLVAALSPASGKAWTNLLKVAGDSCLVTTSWFNPIGTADRWIITQSFQVTDANTYLYWEDATASASFPDSLQILISPTAGTTQAAFTTTLYNKSGSITGFVKKGISLSAYNGQTVRIAFRDNSTDEYLLYLDNVGTEILPSKDLKLTSINPDVNSIVSYGTIGTPNTITGTVTNLGFSTITSYVVKYKQGNNPAISETKSANILPYGTANFSFNTPYNISALGPLPVKVWVELAGDANSSNDSLNTLFTGVSVKPTKKLLVEEATGTWCGWCVRGIVYMDSMEKMHGDVTSLVAVHNADPMVVGAYDTWMNTQISGYPSVVIDRRETADPSEIFTYYNAQKDYFGFADLILSKPVLTGTTLTLPVAVKPSITLSGDYRLSMIITEDKVHSASGSTWDQHNYYSNQSQNLPLSGGGVNYQTQPSTIPASQMYYNFVGRQLVGGINGVSGSLPASMPAGQTFNYTLTTTLDTNAWKVKNIRPIVLLIRNSDGVVLNSNNARYTLEVKETLTALGVVKIYPNPASDAVRVSFSLDQNTPLTIDVLDITGKVVLKGLHQNLSAGNQDIELNTSSLTNGLYQVRIQKKKKEA